MNVAWFYLDEFYVFDRNYVFYFGMLKTFGTVFLIFISQWNELKKTKMKCEICSAHLYRILKQIPTY